MSYEPTVWVDGDHVTSAKLNKLEQGVNSMSYTPTVWNAGDVVTAEKLNKLEQGVAEGGGGGAGFIPTVVTSPDTMTYTCDIPFNDWVSLIESSELTSSFGTKIYPSYDPTGSLFYANEVDEDEVGTYVWIEGYRLYADGSMAEDNPFRYK